MRQFFRGHVKIVIVLLFVAAFLILFFQDVVCILCRDSENVKIGKYLGPTISRSRLVTKSLSELRKMRDLNGHVLMFNSVPNAGSEMFVLILQWLQGKNNFRHVRLSGKTGNFRYDEQELAEEVSTVIQELAVPLSFDCSTYFVNFTKFGWDLPTYFSVIRDPSDSIAVKFNEKFSNFHINQSENTEPYQAQDLSANSGYNLSIPYFCGHDAECSRANSKWALAMAKENVKKYYPVVGILGLVEETLLVLENKLKFYFRGSQKIYLEKFKEKHNKWKHRKKLKKKTENKYLKKIYKTEYVFYNWIKERLLFQLKKFKIDEMSTEKTTIYSKYNFQIEQP